MRLSYNRKTCCILNLVAFVAGILTATTSILPFLDANCIKILARGYDCYEVMGSRGMADALTGGEPEAEIKMTLNSEIFQEVSKDQGCINGQIFNWPPVCESRDCLETISHRPNISLPRPQGLSPVLKREVQEKIWGSETKEGLGAFTIHLKLMSYLTDMQWSFGVYGSVGELGVRNAKFSSGLVLNMDVEAGERYFASALFKKDAALQGFLNRISEWNVNIGDGVDEDRHIRLWKDKSAKLSKALFMYWGLPTVRLVHLDSTLGLLVTKDLAMLGCVLREGAIVILDIEDSSKGEDVVKGVWSFLHIYGFRTLVPILALEDKLYMTTASNYESYTEYIEQIIAPKLPTKKLRRATNNILGYSYTYFIGGFYVGGEYIVQE